MSKAVATRTIRFVRLSPTSFKSTVFRRTNSILSTPPVGGEYNHPIPDGGLWSDGIPDGEEILWASTRVFSSDGKYPQEDEWSTPRKMTDTADFDVEYSSVENPENPPQGHPNTNTEWSNESDPTTIWMATSKKNNGVWEDWKVSKIKGEKGAKGDNGDSANPNILYNTNFAKEGLNEWYIRKVTEGNEGKFGNKYVYAEAGSTEYLDFLAQLIVDENNTKGISPSTWYTLSFWAKGTKVYSYFYDRGNPLVDTNEDYYVNGVNMGKNTHSDGECAHSINSENEWTFHSYTFKTKADIAYTRLLFRIPTNNHVSISSIKFEEGMRPTPWCLSEYDRRGENAIDGVFTSKFVYSVEKCERYSTSKTPIDWGDGEVTEPKNGVWKSGNHIQFTIKCENGDNYVTYQEVVDELHLLPISYYVVKRGLAGKNSFVVDSDNEMIPVAVDKNGKCVSQVSDSFTVKTYYGSATITSGVTVSATSSKSIVTVTDKGGGLFGVNIAAKSDWSKDKKVDITIKATHSTYGEAKTQVSVLPVYPGADGITPVIYQIWTSLTSLQFANDNGHPSGTRKVFIKISKKEGDSVKILESVPSGYHIYGSISESYMTEIKDLGLGEDITDQELSSVDSRYYYIELWKGERNKTGGTMIDRETLPIIMDGDKGDPGSRGEKGAILRAREWKDVPVGSLFMSGKQGEEFLDIAYYPSKNGEKIPYKCMKSHVKTSDNYPYGPVDIAEKNWQRAETTEFIATKLILAERIGADQIDVDELVVNKLETSRIENEPKIEIQDGMMNIFGSSGVANIKIGIVPDGEPNAGTAIFQFFDNDGRMKFDLGAGGLREINSATFVEIKLGFMAKDFHGLPNKYDLISNIKSPTPKKYYRYQSSSTGGVDVNNGNIYTEKRTSSPKIEDGWYTQSIGAAIYGPHIITEEDILIGMTSYDNFYYMRPIVKIIGGKMTMEQRMVYWAKEPDRETITKNK